MTLGVDMHLKIKDFCFGFWWDTIVENCFMVMSVVFMICWAGFIAYLVTSTNYERKTTIDYVKSLNDAEQLEIFKSCVISYEFNCESAVAAYKKLKVR
jgi:hypothetical protein